MPVLNHLKNGALVCVGVLLTFTFSISLTFLNNNVIKAYPYPLSITFLHLLFKFAFAWLVRTFLTCFTGRKRVELPWKAQVLEVSPTGIASSLDIGFSNWSFEFITVSLYTMTKSTSIVFILIFSIIFKLEKLNFAIVIVVVSISTGLFMFTYESTQFDFTGFALVLTASALSGIRWTAAQKLTQRSKYGLKNPVDVIYHAQPWMSLVLLPLTVAIEGNSLMISPFLFRSRDYASIFRILGYFIAGASLAFVLEVAEFLVIFYSSSLTLSIAGIVKEVMTLYLAAVINGDTYSTINIIGLVICLAGICLHVALKFIKHAAILRVLLCLDSRTQGLRQHLRAHLPRYGRSISLPHDPLLTKLKN